jgi:hypothetical protein
LAGTGSERTDLTTGVSETRCRASLSRRQPNKPLNFTLKGIDDAHPCPTQRGIDKATAEHS